MQWNLIPIHNKLISTKRTERRSHLRLLVDVPAELTEERSKRKVAGIATNIGAGGCYIEASDTFRGGTRVDLSLKFDRETFHCRAIITYTMTCNGVGMGVAFAETNLFDWLAHLGNQPASASPKPATDRKAIESVKLGSR